MWCGRKYLWTGAPLSTTLVKAQSLTDAAHLHEAATKSECSPEAQVGSIKLHDYFQELHWA